MKLREGRRGLVELCLAWTLVLGAAATAGVAGRAQTTATPATTQVIGTIDRGDGTAASGTVLISWPTFSMTSGVSVPAGSTSVTLGAGGALSVQLVPNAGSTPMGSYYTAIYHLSDGTVTREYWVVPAQVGAVQVSAIRSTVLPTSVAMQTVSKAYVDTAITAAVTGHPVDASTPLVLKAGDAMSGPLVLAADPVSPLQASDKQYVDAQVAGVASALGQKLNTQAQATQTIAQPAGTQLDVNILNGMLHANDYPSGAGNNGIANAAASADCASGCQVRADQTYASSETALPTTWTNKTHVEDDRGGAVYESFLNPLPPQNPGLNAAKTITVVSTQSAQAVRAATGSGQVFSTGLVINNEALAGGSNQFPASVQGSVPYFKSTYTGLSLAGTNYTLGQHVLFGETQDCYGVGDCLMGGMYMRASGGFRDNADEGSHPFDRNFAEDARVFEGTCAQGCTQGATVLQVAVTANGGTQGEGRYLIDTNPAKVIGTGTLIGGVPQGGRHPVANFTGTTFPVSVLLDTAQTIPSQTNVIAPGTVSVAIVTSGVPTGYAASTAALPAASGVACIADAGAGGGQFETAAYTVVDASHVQLTLIRPHASGATIAVGGLCGYGLEQTVDTINGIRQVFPVVASTSATSLFYAGGIDAIVGVQGSTSAYANISLVVASIARTGNVVSLTTVQNMPADINGLPMTIQGVTDSSYNGTYVVTTTGANSLTYVDNGPNSTSTSGKLSYTTGSFNLYPMAEVLSVYNQTTKAVDGQMTLAANSVSWAAGDSLELPHYFQEWVSADQDIITEYTPRAARNQSAGVFYAGNNGPGLSGFQIQNAVPVSSYFGNGGTHSVPNSGLNIVGVWGNGLEMQAGEGAAVSVHCNSHGCNTWNSAYNLFQMDTGVGQDSLNYSPATSTLNFNLRGTQFQFNPSGMTAGTIHATTVNAGTLTGLFQGTVAASSLPVFGGSGAAHGVGAVPDPGATAGTTRFLREDGSWTAAGTSNIVSSASGFSTMGPLNFPQRGNLLGEYLLAEGAGTVAHDTSGAGNDGTISGATWEGKADLNFAATGEYIQLPTPVNAAQTFQFAIYQPPFGSTAYPLAPGYGDPVNFPINPSLLSATGAGVTFIQSSVNGAKAMRFQAYGTDATEAGQALAPGWHIVTLICGGNGLNARYLYDGQEVGSYVHQGNSTCPTAPSGNYQIGGSSRFTGTWFFGKVAAAWAWSTQLTISDAATAAASALNYIHSKGVPAGYSSLTPQAPVIVAGLDSRTQGAGLTPTTVWPAMMTLTDTTYTRVNLGSTGAEAFDMCNQFPVLYGQQAGAGSAPVIAVIWGGVNDIQNGSQSARQIANSLKCIVQGAKGLGWRVVLATEISSGTGTAGDAGKDALDAILRAEAFSWGADNLADLATDPVLGADGASANTTIFPDNLHPSATGETHVTAVMQDAVNELLGATESNRHQTAAASYTETAGDRYLDLTGTSAQAVTLPSCTGYSLSRQMVNLGVAASTVAPVSGQTLAGSGTLAVGARAVFVPVPGALATGGCRWERTQ